MKRTLTLCITLCVTALVAEAGAAKSVVLQTIDLTDRGMSTEGGEVSLYRVTTAKSAYCRIEATHLGETGKTIYAFAFNPRLFSAAKREYDYDASIWAKRSIKQTLANTETLKTKVGAATLPAAFAEYRAFFDAHMLASCLQS
jgi:hypothetical protein